LSEAKRLSVTNHVRRILYDGRARTLNPPTSPLLIRIVLRYIVSLKRTNSMRLLNMAGTAAPHRPPAATRTIIIAPAILP
jgi:hypothetical protein